MKWLQKHKGILVEVTCYLFILLFVYAAVSKLMDFENFRVQLGQSPLLTAFAGWVAWAVPAVEILISGMLIFPRLRLWALYAAFSLMVMFTAYIVIILNFSDFIPCSCGGVLEKLGWREHLFFNLVFVFFGATGFLLNTNSDFEFSSDNFSSRSPFWKIKFQIFRKPVYQLGLGALSGIGLIVLMYFISEHQIHRHNNFTRRYAGKPVRKIFSKDLKVNSYYINGIDKNHVYLGNNTSPLLLTKLEILGNNLDKILIQIPEDSLPFHSIQMKVFPPNLFLMDGTVPYILKANIKDGIAKPVVWSHPYYFVKAEPMGDSYMAILARSSKTRRNVLGSISWDSVPEIQLSKKLPPSKGDGVFDIDGSLLFNASMKRLIYVYRYSNLILVVKPNLELVSKLHTIDTIIHPQLKIGHLKKTGQMTFAAPPLIVNAHAATYGNYLFVHSRILGHMESERLWKRNSVIDVYDLTNRSYQFSFYIGNSENAKLRDFKVYGNLLVALIGTHIEGYQLSPTHFNYSNINNNTLQ